MTNKESPKCLRWIDTGIFPATVLFSCGFDWKEFETLLKKKKANDWLNGMTLDNIFLKDGKYYACHRTIKSVKDGKPKEVFYIIFKDKFTFTDIEYCYLAHEVLHICQFFLPQILDRNIEIEAEAYLHTHLMSKILETLRG